MATQKLLYVTNTDSNDISVVDVELQEEVKRIPVGGSPRGAVKFDKAKKYGYVSNCAGDTISKIDLNDNIEVGRIKVKSAPRGLAVTADGNYAFISNSGANNLSLISLQDCTIVRDLCVSSNPRHMALLQDESKLLVCEWGSDTVAVFDLTNGIEKISLVARINVGADARPYSLAVDSDGEFAYVANTQADYMSVINIAELGEVDRISVGFGGRAIALSEDETTAYESIENTNSVVRVELSSRTVTGTVGVGPNPRGLVIDHSDDKLYVSAFTRSDSNPIQRNTLSVVDIETLQFDSDIKVGLGPCSVSFLEIEI